VNLLETEATGKAGQTSLFEFGVGFEGHKRENLAVVETIASDHCHGRRNDNRGQLTAFAKDIFGEHR
jgi:hypothetical protein